MRRHTDVMPAPARLALPSVIGGRPFDLRRAAAIVAGIGFALYLFALAHSPFAGGGR